MIQVKTNKSLLAALKEAASRELTGAELEEQYVSFVMGTVGEKNNLTREEVREILKSNGRLATAS